MALKETATDLETLSGVHQLDDDYYLLADAQAVVQLTGEKVHDQIFSKDSPKDSKLYASWGNDNLQPQRMLKLVFQNHIKPQLLVTTRDFVLGSRLGLFKRTIVDGKWKLEPVMNPEIEDWLEMIDYKNYLRSAGYNLEYFANTFSCFDLDSKKRIESLISYDAIDIRAEKKDKKGRINHFYYHPDWKTAKDEEVQTIPAFDRMDLTRFGQFMYHGRDRVPGQPYYDAAAWWGTETWTEVSNLIPRFHKSGLNNGYNIKYHIKIPRDYFTKFGDLDKQLAAEKKLKEEMNTFLAGVDNAEKAFVSKFGLDANGKMIPGFEIVPLENKMSDDAYTAVNNQANIAHTSGHGIDPSLAGIDTGGKMGGSGSEKRISYQLHIALRTTVKREILLEPFQIAHRIHNWPKDIIFGFEDIDITTIDKNPTGTQAVVNQAISK